MKFYAGPTFLFSNTMACRTFDVDIIMNALLTNTNMVTLINRVSNRNGYNNVSTCALGYIQL